MKNKDKVLVIDTFYFLHRAFHAYPINLRTSSGEVSNMVYGFAGFVLDFLIKLKPKYLAFSWETEEQPTFRKTLYKSYQLNRMFGDPDEEELFRLQLSRIQEFINTLNVKFYKEEGFEGDDVIGTLAKNLSNDNEVIVATADQDMLQLVDKNTTVFRPAKPPYLKEEMFTTDKVKEKYGFLPHQMIDYKALRGDPSDNIPGVKGIGEKTAKDLIEKFDSLDGIYANLDKVKSEKVKALLEKEKNEAYLSRQLATIIVDMPITLDVNEIRLNNINYSKLDKFLTDMQFKSLSKKLAAVKIIYNNKTSPQLRLA